MRYPADMARQAGQRSVVMRSATVERGGALWMLAPPRVLCSLLAGEERRCGEGQCTMDARPPPSPVLPPRWSVWGEDV